jgi:hypothetical protein
MSNEPEKYTITIQPVGDHLQVTISDLGIVVETEPGQMKRVDAERAATRAITEYVLKQREEAQARAS